MTLQAEVRAKGTGTGEAGRLASSEAQERNGMLALLEEFGVLLQDPELQKRVPVIDNKPETRQREIEKIGRDIEGQSEEVRGGRYRVVILGPFNVGKSTFINALLGGEYLPTMLEEMTAKLTHVCHSESAYIRLDFTKNPSGDEIREMETLVRKVPGAELKACSSDCLQVNFKEGSPDAVRQVLEALVTVIADEDHPALRPLREKMKETHLGIPDLTVGEHITLSDSPGVHSISDTRQEITYQVIPRSQLVVLLVDSENAGNVHDLEFIRRISENRQRKIFFVLNKCDQLASDEIDPRGRRGPAKSLRESLRKIQLEDPEVFFVSSLYELKAEQLDRGHISLEDIDGDDSKVRIPNRIWQGEPKPSPADISGYLRDRSLFGPFRSRLLDYLFKEDTEVAVVRVAANFLLTKVEALRRPVETELSLAKDPARLDELIREKAEKTKEIEDFHTTAKQVVKDYKAKSHGYERSLKELLCEAEVETHVVEPIKSWLAVEANIKKARKDTKELEQVVVSRLDDFVARVMKRINAEVRGVEQDTLEEVGRLSRKAHNLGVSLSDPTVRNITVDGDPALFRSLGGAAVGAVVGAVVFSWSGPGALIAAGVGAILGGLAGFFTSDDTIREQYLVQVRNAALDISLHGRNEGGKRESPLIETLGKELRTKRDSFNDRCQKYLDDEAAKLTNELAGLEARQDQIKREAEEIVAALTPISSRLMTIEERAGRLAGSGEVR